MKKTIYMVMTLCKKVQVKNVFTDEYEDIPVSGIYGYAPVFETKEEAEKYADGLELLQIEINEE